MATLNTSSPSSVSSRPSLIFSNAPSSTLSLEPSITGSDQPSIEPSNVFSDIPSVNPTYKPSQFPSLSPSNLPSVEPSSFPTVRFSDYPSSIPSTFPTTNPPVTSIPSTIPSTYPSSSNMPSSVSMLNQIGGRTRTGILVFAVFGAVILLTMFFVGFGKIIEKPSEADDDVDDIANQFDVNDSESEEEEKVERRVSSTNNNPQNQSVEDPGASAIQENERQDQLRESVKNLVNTDGLFDLSMPVNFEANSDNGAAVSSSGGDYSSGIDNDLSVGGDDSLDDITGVSLES